MGLLDSIKRLDMYKSVEEDLTRQTVSGASVSLVTLLTVLIFVVVEYSAYANPEMKTITGVAPRMEPEVGLAFDVYLERVPCGSLRVEAHDEDSSHTVDLKRHVRKTPVTVGKGVKPAKGKKLGERAIDEEHILEMGEGVEVGSDEANWMASSRLVKEAWKQQNGCRVSGRMSVPTVPGNLQIIVDMPGLERAIGGDKDAPPLEELDTSHVVEGFNFIPVEKLDDEKMKIESKTGKAGMLTKLARAWRSNPASNKVERLGGPLESFNYHTQVVSVYTPGNVNCTYQDAYSYSRFKAPGQARLDFHYSFSPISIMYAEEEVSFFRTLSYMFSAIGGIYVVSLFVNGAVNMKKSMTRKSMEGKFG